MLQCHGCTEISCELLVTSRIDYCNSLLNGIPKTTLNKRQNVQNTATRLITRTSRRSHITPLLKDLHWLPIQYRIQLKIRVITYKALQGKSPLYVRNLLHVYKPTRNDHRTMPLHLRCPKTRKVMFESQKLCDCWSQTLEHYPRRNQRLQLTSHF